jgi:chromosome segregation ATPase
MWTGRQTLASIESAISDLRREEGQLDTALRSAVAETERLRKERSDALRELARVKLDEMAAGRLVSNLDAGERRAAQILDDYRLRIAALAERREALVEEVAAAEAQRHAAAGAVETALAAVEAVRAQADSTARTTPAWQQAKAASDAAAAIAAEADKKAATAEADLGAKKKPYDDDPLFIYLWRRRFGTSAYGAGNFVRYMDRKVADFIGFLDARPNYAALIEIPLRLREHATAKQQEAAQAQSALSEVERRAMLEAGMEPKERALAEARHKLAAAEETLEGKNGLLRKLDEDRNALVSGGTDPAYNEALSTIASADSKDDLRALYQEARRTPTSADDAIVRRLETIDASVARTETEIGRLRGSAMTLAGRRAEVQQVRDRFRSAGYDHPHATFGNENAIADTLKQVLAGAAGAVLWDLLRGGYSYRGPRGGQDFGFPNQPFPFPLPGGGGKGGSSGGDWRDPSNRGGWSAGDDDSGSSDHGGDSGSRDDFSTGGSF